MTLIVAIVSALLVAWLACLGNWLAQRWQQRNWLTQHTLQRAEKDLGELRKLIDELLRLGNARVYRMQRLVKNLRSANDESFTIIKRDYEQAVVSWNDQLNSLAVGLRLYAHYHYTDRLEATSGIQPLFVETSEEIDSVLKERNSRKVSNSTVASLEQKLNALSGSMFNIGKELTDLLIERQREAYEGKRIVFSPETAELFPSWYLLKALFKPLNPSEAVSSSELNLRYPFVARSQRSWIN